MIELYTSLHTAAIKSKTLFLKGTVFLLTAVLLQMKLQAQCTPPPVPVVTPNPAYMCVSDPPLLLRIVPQPFCSGTVAVAVPDNNAAGASSSIVVSGMTANCTIMSAAVTINMTHSRIGDMVFVLKAPNGQVINLDYRISASGSVTATTGFVNTVISSLGTVSFNAGVSPYTGTFRADAQLTAAGGLGAAGPTGMQPTTSGWSSLFTVPNGSWTLGFYDAATGETGTLNSWCLNFTTPCNAGGPTFSKGIWTPAAGLYLDPAGAVPYIAGTATDSVWAKPFPAGTYTYQVTTQSLPLPGCTSPPATVTVIVNGVLAVTTPPANQAVCAGNDAHFTVTANGSGLSYQWQVSANGGATFTNIANAAPYSGVNSATLNIAAPALSMNRYYYRVIVYSGSGCFPVYSYPAMLTVHPLPQVSFYAVPYTLLQAGQTTTLHAVVTPNPGAIYNWWKDGAIVPGANADTLVIGFPDIGVYQAAVTDINGCSGISDTMSIRDWAHGRMLIYPNPAGAQFKVRLYSDTYPAPARTLIIYDNNGNKVLTTAYTQNSSSQQINVDLRKHGKGVYWVEIKDKDGKRISIARVLVQ